LARAHPALAQAHGLYHNAALPQRAEVEARLLAGECDASIETKCQLAPAPVMILIRVDLPAPFSPTRACISPARRSNDTPLSARTPPKLLLIPVSRSNVCT